MCLITGVVCVASRDFAVWRRRVFAVLLFSFLYLADTRVFSVLQMICQLVMKAIQWPPEYTDEDKITVWNDVLSKLLKPLMSEYKNKIHQPMRHTFNGKLFFIDIFRSNAMVLIYFILYS